MDEKIVGELEAELGKAILETVFRLGLKRLPLLPAQETVHMMAKAAVSVYEAVVDEHNRISGQSS